MQWLIFILNAIKTLLGIHADYKELKDKPTDNSKVIVTEEDLKERFSELFETIVSIYKLLGKEDALNSSIVTDILNNIIVNGELTNVGKVVAEALEDGVITKKEMVKIVLAYSLYSDEITIDKVKTSQALADYAGYKRPTNLAVQVDKTLTKLLK